MKSVHLVLSLLLLLVVLPARAEDEPAARAVEPEVRVTLSRDGEVEESRSAVAAEVVDQVQREVDEALSSLPRGLDEAMTEAERARFEADLERLRQLKKNGADTDYGVTIDTRFDYDGESTMENLIGLVAVLMFFGTPIMIVAIISYNGRRKREMVHNTIDRMIESGQPVPSELLDALDQNLSGSAAALRRALISIALGAAVIIFFWQVAGGDVASLGLIPLFIGIAYLVIWWLERNKGNASPA